MTTTMTTTVEPTNATPTKPAAKVNELEAEEKRRAPLAKRLEQMRTERVTAERDRKAAHSLYVRGDGKAAAVTAAKSLVSTIDDGITDLEQQIARIDEAISRLREAEAKTLRRAEVLKAAKKSAKDAAAAVASMHAHDAAITEGKEGFFAELSEFREARAVVAGAALILETEYGMVRDDAVQALRDAGVDVDAANVIMSSGGESGPFRAIAPTSERFANISSAVIPIT